MGGGRFPVPRPRARSGRGRGRARDELEELEDAGDPEDPQDLDDADDPVVAVGLRAPLPLGEARLPRSAAVNRRELPAVARSTLSLMAAMRAAPVARSRAAGSLPTARTPS